ncbi:hypothetical protein B566_EDAN006101 [Ephemera danica]|nr:hypothetical protein B566_EDAN006101 [Ephemera danica]
MLDMKAALVLLVLATSLALLHAAKPRWEPSKPRGSRHRTRSQEDQVQERDLKTAEKEGRDFMDEYNRLSAFENNKATLAEWAYDSNITEHNLKNKLAVSQESAKFFKEKWTQLIKFPWQQFSDPDLKRQFKIGSVLGNAILSEEEYKKYEETVKLTELLMSSRNEKELKHIWVEWRKASGEKVRGLYKDYVDLSNKAATLNNFTDASALWLRSYEASDFRDQISTLWDQLQPLYQQLHAYVRRHLRAKYGDDVIKSRGPIPAHLLGNMWAQTWSNIKDFMLPYPNRPSTDVTPNMVKQGYTPLKMFKLSEQFFTSLNLSAMPESFWEKSILEKPADGRELVCHASAWDFYDAKDFRVKQCTRPTQRQFFTAHHEMGHVQYFLQYKHQPVTYRTGANPGFHEAVGDVMSLSVSTPKHLRAIGLLDEANSEEDKEAEREATINHLFSTALDKIAFLPFAYMLDLWRWDVFEGRTQPEEYNCAWWRLREKYQGLEPPVHRSEEDFDPAAKYHVVASVPYIRYFVSFVIQFQFHKALCEKAGQLEGGAPLHECDIYKSTAAGNLLGDMLQLGSSKPWPEAMALVTGQPRMDAGALREYFAPLETWLKAENERTGEFIGWEKSTKYCVQTREELSRLYKENETKVEDEPVVSSGAQSVHSTSSRR